MKTFLVFKHGLNCSHQQSKLFCTLTSRIKQEWEAVIGLEIHAQISTKSKLFSGAATQYKAAINDQVAHLDAALPGTLPVINKQCVKAAAYTAVALNCHVNLVSRFDRKHYFYADLPAGYQITQQRQPLAVGGHVDYITWVRQNNKRWLEPRRARLTQLQLEQDSGKSLHDPQESISLIDLNRAGIGLMEIVTEPDFRTASEATGFVRELQHILYRLGTCDGRMAEGSLRVDASISVRHPGHPLGTRTEVKNINSARFVAHAIEYEIKRQIDVLESGDEVTNETRNYDFESGTTIAMRDKERLHDYRFLPEPNLPPLRLYSNDTLPVAVDPTEIINIDKLKGEIPELPHEIRMRLQNNYGISLEKAAILVDEEGLVEVFELAVKRNKEHVKTIVNFSTDILRGCLNSFRVTLSQSRLTHTNLMDIFDLLCQEKILEATAGNVMSIIMDGSNKSVPQIVQEKDWFMISDETTITELCSAVVKNSPKFVKDFIRYQNNPRKRERVVSNFVKAAYVESGERINKRQITPIIRKLLEEHL